MNITPINHITELKDRFLAQYEDKPNLTQFIEILFSGYQNIENLLLDIISKRYLVNATGQILTDLASNFNLDRVDYSDDTLRALI
jgi:hypothetical protein